MSNKKLSDAALENLKLFLRTACNTGVQNIDAYIREAIGSGRVDVSPRRSLFNRTVTLHFADFDFVQEQRKLWIKFDETGDPKNITWHHVGGAKQFIEVIEND